MKHAITHLPFALLAFTFVISTAYTPDVPQPFMANAPHGFDAPYEIDFDIDSTENGEYSLVVTMKLAEGSYFVSPYSSDRFSGRFDIATEKSAHLALETSFIESPRSPEEFDPHPFIDGDVNWVRENTSYTHRIRIATEEDFSVHGQVSFTIEPRCTFEEVSFLLSHQNGILTVMKGTGC